MIKRVILVCLTLLFILCPLLSFGTNNVIIEKNFDSGIPDSFDKEAYVGETAKFSWSENGGRNNSGCLVIECDTENDARFKYTVNAEKKTYYKISAYIKTENVSSRVEKGANLSIDLLYDVYGNFFGTRDWTYVEFYGLTGASQTSFTVLLRLGGYGSTNTGKAYFDDFKVEKIDKLPAGEEATALYTESQVVKKPALYTDSMRVASLLIVFTSFVFIVIYKYLRNKTNALESGMTLAQKVFMLVFVGMLLRMVLTVTAPQCSIDVNLFQYWAKNAAQFGYKLYVPQNNIDYPPGYMHILLRVGKISEEFKAYGTSLGIFLIKMPAIICDGIIAFIIYKTAGKKLSPDWVLFIVACWVFNPVVILDSAAWGQVDSVLSLALVLCIYYLTKDKYGVAGVWFAVGVMIKPQALFIAPIIFYALLKHSFEKESVKEKLLPFVYTVTSFLVTFVLIALPFWVHKSKTWIIDLYTGTAEGYKYITVNALNFHFLMGNNWVADTTNKYKGITLFAWGMFAIVIASLIAMVLHLKNKRLSSVPYLMSSVLIYLVVNFGPRMHERYFFPIIALLLFAIIKMNNKWLLYIYGLTSAVNFMIVMEIMTDLNVGSSIDRSYNWPELNTFRGTLAFINVACSVLLLIFAVLYSYGFFKGKKHQIWDTDDEEEMIAAEESMIMSLVNRLKPLLNRNVQKDVEEWSVDNDKKN